MWIFPLASNKFILLGQGHPDCMHPRCLGMSPCGEWGVNQHLTLDIISVYIEHLFKGVNKQTEQVARGKRGQVPSEGRRKAGCPRKSSHLLLVVLVMFHLFRRLETRAFRKNALLQSAKQGFRLWSPSRSFAKLVIFWGPPNEPRAQNLGR